MAVMGTGIPAKVMVKHRYVQQFNMISPGAGGSLVYRISANNMHAPTVTSVGPDNSHQPMYFDQYAQLYDHFVVIGAKITFKIGTNPGSAASAYTAAAFVDDNSSVISASALQVAEQTQGSKLVLFSGNENDVKTITLTWSAKKVFGGSILANAALEGSSVAGPAEQSDFALCLSSLGTFNCLVVATVEYVAIWKELKEAGQS